MSAQPHTTATGSAACTLQAIAWHGDDEAVVLIVRNYLFERHRLEKLERGLAVLMLQRLDDPAYIDRCMMRLTEKRAVVNAQIEVALADWWPGIGCDH